MIREKVSMNINSVTKYYFSISKLNSFLSLTTYKYEVYVHTILTRQTISI